MKLLAIPAFSDNYLWLLHDSRRAIVVDPGQAEPVMDCLREHRLALQTILVTHHHADHVGGLAALRKATGAHVVGPIREPIPELQERVQQGDVVEALGLRFSVMDVPGHTAGHIAFYAECPGEPPLLFCGDTLFSGGCGRLFEGTPAQMLASLDALAALPDNTRVCCAHEYTLANLRFALAVEPENAALRAYYAQCETLRGRGQPTLPTTIGVERVINPFLRSRERAVVTSVAAHAPHTDTRDTEAVFAALREWKNQF